MKSDSSDVDGGANRHLTSEESSGISAPGPSPACKVCSASTSPPFRVYCSERCRRKARNGRVPRYPATCAQCGVAFKARWQYVTRSFDRCCSTKCAGLFAKSHGILARENNPRWIDGRSRIIRDRYPDKAAAHYAVTKAIRRGDLVRQPCERCGTTWRVHAHHDDYSKPLEVRWLCQTHHHAVHVELRGGHAEKPAKPPEPEWLTEFRKHTLERRAAISKRTRTKRDTEVKP